MMNLGWDAEQETTSFDALDRLAVLVGRQGALGQNLNPMHCVLVAANLGDDFLAVLFELGDFFGVVHF